MIDQKFYFHIQKADDYKIILLYLFEISFLIQAGAYNQNNMA